MLVAGMVACARQPDRCWICEREIHAQVRSTLTLADGRRVQACCPRCALHYKEEPGNAVIDLRVSDYRSAEPLALEAAYLVEGSDETPCLHHPPPASDTRAPLQVCYDRCMPSLIAFRDEEAARSFIGEHGGALHQPGAFTGLWRRSR